MPIAETEIPKHYVPTFERNILHANQQIKSKLREHVSEQSAMGEMVSPVDLFDETEAEEANDRYGDTPIMEIGRSRRWVGPKKFDWGTMVDGMDQLKQVLDPTSPMVEAAKRALWRKLDRSIIMPAFFGNVMQGKDITDAGNPANQVAFDVSKYRIQNTVGSPGGVTPTGMNVEKLQAAKKMFMQNEVDTDVERPKVAITSQQWDDLFKEVKVIHGDYINGRPIHTGDLPVILGFDFVQIEQLPHAGTAPNDRYNPVWVKRGIALRMWKDVRVMLGVDPGKKYRVRPYVEMAGGACRTQEGLVLQVVCREPT